MQVIPSGTSRARRLAENVPTIDRLPCGHLDGPVFHVRIVGYGTISVVQLNIVSVPTTTRAPVGPVVSTTRTRVRHGSTSRRHHIGPIRKREVRAPVTVVTNATTREVPTARSSKIVESVIDTYGAGKRATQFCGFRGRRRQNCECRGTGQEDCAGDPPRSARHADTPPFEDQEHSFNMVRLYLMRREITYDARQRPRQGLRTTTKVAHQELTHQHGMHTCHALQYLCGVCWLLDP